MLLLLSLASRLALAISCQSVGTPSVNAICDSQPLLLLDLRMERDLGSLRRKLGPEGRKLLSAEQRAWARRRDACDGDLGCLDTSYRERIAELGRGPRREWIVADSAPEPTPEPAPEPEAIASAPSSPAPTPSPTPTPTPVRPAQTLPIFCDTSEVTSGDITYAYLRKFGAGRDQCLPMLKGSSYPRQMAKVNRGIATVVRQFVCDTDGKWTAKGSVELADKELFSVRWSHLHECKSPARRFETANTWDLRTGRELRLQDILKKEKPVLKDCPDPGRVEFALAPGKLLMWSAACPTKTEVSLGDLKDPSVVDRLL